LAVFVPFSILYMGQPFKPDFVWAGLCLLGAVYFIFR
ncbi:MAG: DMT family protein, partial [Polynucleobacter victoriensis]